MPRQERANSLPMPGTPHAGLRVVAWRGGLQAHSIPLSTPEPQNLRKRSSVTELGRTQPCSGPHALHGKRKPGALPVQDCNWVVHDSLGATLFQSATTAAQYNPSTIGEDLVVTPPCRAVVSGAGGGFVAIIDSFASGGDRSDTALYTRPFVGNGIMLGGQLVPQVLRPATLL